MQFNFFEIAGIISLILIFFFLILPPFIVYMVILVRVKKSKWGRYKGRWSKNKELKTMVEEGEIWRKKHEDYSCEVSVKSDGLKLSGIYFDFKNDKAVIIIAGRAENCIYSCFYAEPYRKAGYNVLVIDNRCHGKSEGVLNTAGYKEYVDILEWGKFLKEEKNNVLVLCHGICMGAATAMYALTAPDCPDYMGGLIADGMFTTFRATLKNHLIDFHAPVHLALFIILFLLSIFSGQNAFRKGPVTEIKKYQKPVLFLYGLKDKYSFPAQGLELYEKCKAPKKFIWFEQGSHSHLRITNIKKYDEKITEFLEKYFVK